MTMAKHNITGKDGEAIARKYLDEHGYLILDTNWHLGHLEADIIAFKDERIVFIEVKTRSSEDFGEPEDFVDWKKRRAYVRLANAYVMQKDLHNEARFDIISIIMDKPSPHVNHIVDAFFTTDC